MTKSVQLLLMSASRLQGHQLMQQHRDDIVQFLKKRGITRTLFLPFAGFDYDKYTAEVATAFENFGSELIGIHSLPDAAKAIEQAECIFIGGGNSFKLLKHLCEAGLVEPIRRRVLAGDLAYMGSSAGTNVATRSIHTTNDMPIMYPPTFAALALVPFNINPHYLDADPSSSHQGETREQRIGEFLEVHDVPVLGLREGTILRVDGARATLLGGLSARLFRKGQPAVEIQPLEDLSYLLNFKE